MQADRLLFYVPMRAENGAALNRRSVDLVKIRQASKVTRPSAIWYSAPRADRRELAGRKSHSIGLCVRQGASGDDQEGPRHIRKRARERVGMRRA